MACCSGPVGLFEPCNLGVSQPLKKYTSENERMSSPKKGPFLKESYVFFGGVDEYQIMPNKNT